MRRSATMLAATLLLSLASPAQASPAASKILHQAQRFGKTLRTVEATVRVQRGPSPSFPLINGARQALSRGLVLRDTSPWEKRSYELSPEWPATPDVPLRVERNKTFTLGDQTVELKKIGKDDTHSAEIRALALALTSTHIPKLARRRMKTRMAYEVLTLDRIDERYVWAIGDDKIALWFDREVYRPVRIELGPDVIDEHHWTIRMHYNDEGTGKGWFPDRFIVEQNREVTSTYTVTHVSF